LVFQLTNVADAECHDWGTISAEMLESYVAASIIRHRHFPLANRAKQAPNEWRYSHNCARPGKHKIASIPISFKLNE
jgi:hypothetical protein